MPFNLVLRPFTPATMAMRIRDCELRYGASVDLAERIFHDEKIKSPHLRTGAEVSVCPFALLPLHPGVVLDVFLLK